MLPGLAVIPPVIASGPAIDPSVAAYAVAVAGAGGSVSSGRQALLSTMVTDLKADGVWALLDWFVVCAAEDNVGARYNLVTPTKSLSATNSPTFTADRGYQGDGSAAYLDFGEAPSAGGNQLVMNSNHLGFYINNPIGAGANVAEIGTAAANTLRVLNTASGNGLFSVADATNTIYASGGRAGYRVATRPDAATKNIYVAPTNTTPTTTAAIASTSMAAGNMTGLRNNTTYSPDRMALMHTGSALTGAHALAAYTRILTFLTAIGAN